MTKVKIDAVDVLNWNYLAEIGELVTDRATNPEMAFKGFAYAFTSTANEEIRNQMLVDILRNATYGTSVETNEEFIAHLANRFKSDRSLLRQFAKENGIRLERG
jgi:hypothetical protein